MMTGSKLKGYFFGAVAAATYGMNPLFALSLYEGGMNPVSVLLWRYLFASLFMALMLKIRGWSFGVSRRALIELALLGVVVALSSLGLFMSYGYMAAGIASTMLFVYPILVAVLMAVVYRERLSTLTVVCLLLATAGIALLYKGDGGGESLSVAGTLLVLGSALCYAVYLVAINRKTLAPIPTLVVTFYVLLCGIPVFLAAVFLGEPLSVPGFTDWGEWIDIVGLALFPTVVSFVCTTVAIHAIGSTPTAILGALEPVTAIIIGLTVFSERLTARDALGIAVIISAVTLVIAGGKISFPLTRFRKLFARMAHRRR